METFEFVVTSIARVALKEHVKIQAERQCILFDRFRCSSK